MFFPRTASSPLKIIQFGLKKSDGVGHHRIKLVLKTSKNDTGNPVPVNFSPTPVIKTHPRSEIEFMFKY